MRGSVENQSAVVMVNPEAMIPSDQSDPGREEDCG
jgi:hypothetical protein